MHADFTGELRVYHSPELCRGHLAKGAPRMGKKHHVQDHVVYLAVSSAQGRCNPRYTGANALIDQGASQARAIAVTPHRCAAGEIEVALKQAFTDRTSWQKMLKNDVLTEPDWDDAFDRIDELLPLRLASYVDEDMDIVRLNYPVQCYPEKVKSLSFDKLETISGKLLGIKGQYLLLDDNRVLNVRKHNGYRLEFSF